MKIQVTHKGSVFSSWELNDGQYKIGRGAECDIRIPSPQISKQHALLVIKGESAAIMDLGSANGTFVNGILVRKHPIGINDEVSIVDYQVRILLNPNAGRLIEIEP